MCTGHLRTGSREGATPCWHALLALISWRSIGHPRLTCVRQPNMSPRPRRSRGSDLSMISPLRKWDVSWPTSTYSWCSCCSWCAAGRAGVGAPPAAAGVCRPAPAAVTGAMRAASAPSPAGGAATPSSSAGAGCSTMQATPASGTIAASPTSHTASMRWGFAGTL